MAQLTSNKKRTYGQVGINEVGVKDGAVIYEGSAVSEAAADGYANQLVAAETFLGFCLEKVDNTGGADGAKTVKLQTKGLLEVSGLTVAATDLGVDIYMSDGDTFTLTSAGNTKVGKLYRFITTTKFILRFDAMNPA